MFYYFVQFLISFYSPGSIFIGWAKYFPQKLHNEKYGESEGLSLSLLTSVL